MASDGRPVDVGRRVFVTGSAGSGKTILADRLGRALGVPVHRLDMGPPPADLELAPSWIVEGASMWDVERFLDRAETIVWLDLRLRHTLHRIIRRHVRLSVLGRNEHRGLRLLWSFLRSQPEYHRAEYKDPEGPTDWAAHTRANHVAMLEPHASRIVQLRTPRATRDWVQRVT